jgi:hypothetical protein
MSLDAAPTDIFVHVIAVPAAGPWDQIRAARMSAELGAPLPVGQSAVCVRRLGGWSPGRPGRFAIGYMRATDQPGERIRMVSVEGRSVRFVFLDPITQRARYRAWLVDAGLAVGVVLCLVAGGWTWEQRRDQAVDALQLRARQANLDLRDRRLTVLINHNLARMDSADLMGRSGAKVAADLAWLDATRDRSSPLTSIAWDDRALHLTTTAARAPMQGAELLAGTGLGGRQWRVAPPAARGGRTKPSVVSRRPHRVVAP